MTAPWQQVKGNPALVEQLIEHCLEGREYERSAKEIRGPAPAYIRASSDGDSFVLYPKDARWVYNAGEERGNLFALFALKHGLSPDDKAVVQSKLAEVLGIEGEEYKPQLHKPGLAPYSPLDLEAYAADYGLTWEQVVATGARVQAWNFYDKKLKKPDVRWGVVYPTVNHAGERSVKVRSLHRYVGTKDCPVEEGSRIREKGNKRWNRHSGKGAGVVFPDALTGTGPLVFVGGEEKAICVRATGLRCISATSGELLQDITARFIAGHEGNDEVIVCFDADEKGRNATMGAATALVKAGVKVVRVVMWPENAPDKQDICDLYQEGGAKAVFRLLESAEIWSPPDWWVVPTIAFPGIGRLSTSDMGEIYQVPEDDDVEPVSLSQCTLRVVERRHIVETNTRTLGIQGRAGGRVFEFDMPASQWNADKEFKGVIGAAGYDINIDGPNGCRAIRAIKDHIAGLFPPREITLKTNGVHIESGRQVYRCKGMIIRPMPEGEMRAYMDGEEGVGPAWSSVSSHAEVRCDRGWGKKHDKTLKQPAGPDQIREIATTYSTHWHQLFDSRVYAALSLGMTVLGPILSGIMRDGPHLVMAFTGTTNTGKSTTARIAAKLWDYETSEQAGRGASEAALQQYVKFCTHALSFIDDFDSGKQIGSVAHFASDGFPRLVLARGGEVREDANVQLCSTVLMTAETLEGAAQSAQNRIIEIPFSKKHPDKMPYVHEALEKLQRFDTAESSALVVAATAMLLTESAETIEAELRRLESRCVKAQGAGRAVQIGARAVFCTMRLKRFFRIILGETAAEWIPKEGELIDGLMKAQSENEVGSKPCQMFLQAVEEEWQTGTLVKMVECHWSGKTAILTSSGGDSSPLRGQQRKVYRIQDVNEPGAAWYAFQIPGLLQALRLDLMPKRVKESMDAEGWTDNRGTSKNPVNIRVDGKQQKLVVIRVPTGD